MTCVKCNATLEQGDRYCGTCGAPQPSGAKTTSVTSTPGSIAPHATAGPSVPQAPSEPAGDGPVAQYNQGLRGAAASAAPSAANLAEYRAMFSQMTEDLLLDDSEAELLRQERRRLGIPDRLHQELMEGIFDGMPFELSYDESAAHFVVGQAAQLNLELRMVSGDVLRSLEVDYRTSIDGYKSHRWRRKNAGKRNSLVLQLGAPPAGGVHKVEGLLTAHFYRNRMLQVEFEVAGMRFDAAGGERGPQEVHINVDAGKAAAGQLNVGNGLGEVRGPQGGFTQGVGKWTPVDLTSLSPAEAEIWRKEHGQDHSAPVAATRPQGAPLRCRGVYLNIWRDREAPREVWWMREQEVTFGRFHDPATNPELELVVEPRTVRANEDQNEYLSRRHVTVRRAEGGVVLIGLSAGQRPPVVMGRPLKRLEATPMLPSATMEVAPQLTLELSAWMNEQGQCEGVYASRRGNVERRSYLLANPGFGLWPRRTLPLGRRQEGAENAPIQLIWSDGAPALLNHAAPGLKSQAGPVALRSTHYLSPGNVYTFDDLHIEVTDDLVRETP